jgi:hypothetical protein
VHPVHSANWSHTTGGRCAGAANTSATLGINDDESPIVAVRKVQYLMKSLLETPFFSNFSKKSLSFSIGTSSDVVKVLNRLTINLKANLKIKNEFYLLIELTYYLLCYYYDITRYESIKYLLNIYGLIKSIKSRHSRENGSPEQFEKIRRGGLPRE